MTNCGVQQQLVQTRLQGSEKEAEGLQEQALLHLDGGQRQTSSIDSHTEYGS